MIKRIIDKQTNIFLRDDFTFDPLTEIGLEVEPAQGLYIPKWNGENWVEGLTVEEIESIKAQAIPQEPTIEDRVVTLEESIEVIFGGVV